MQTLDARVRIVWALQRVVFAGVVGAITAAAVALTDVLPPLPTGVAVGVVVAVLGLVHTVFRYRAWRYDVRDHELFLDRGVLTKVETSVPYVRVQHVDTRRSPFERAVGLGSVVVYTAGSRGADVTIPGLTADRARRLRDRLRDLAIESEGEDAV